MIKQAHYRCCACGHEWKAPIVCFLPGSPTPYNPVEGCPQCLHVYVTWLNYQQDFAAFK